MSLKRMPSGISPTCCVPFQKPAFADRMWYNPESSLGSLLEILIDSWEYDRVEAHGGAPSAFDEAADLFLVGSSEFVRPERSEGELKWTWEQAKYLMANVPYTRERLEIAIAREFVTGVEQKADRCIELAELVLDRRPGTCQAP